MALSSGRYPPHFREEEGGLRDFRQVASARLKWAQALGTPTPGPALSTSPWGHTQADLPVCTNAFWVSQRPLSRAQNHLMSRRSCLGVRDVAGGQLPRFALDCPSFSTRSPTSLGHGQTQTGGDPRALVQPGPIAGPVDTQTLSHYNVPTSRHLFPPHP